MANPDPSRTEQPTSKKISESRQKGNVLTSPDVSSLTILLGGALLLLLTVPMLYDGFYNIYRLITKVDCRYNWDSNSYYHGALVGTMILSKILLPFLLGCCLLAFLVMRFQVGKYFSMQAAKWKFDSLKPNFKSLIPSKDNFVRLLITIAKVSLVGLLIYITINQDRETLFQLVFNPLVISCSWLLKRIFSMVLKVLVLFAAIAVIDYIHRRKRYYDNLMMTRQEVKDERKNAEGDPKIKAKIRMKMRQILMQRMMLRLPEADVVITNPTHVAVALQYRSGSYAPVVLAKGLRKRAEKIKTLARKHKVPIVEAPPLARSLYRNSKVGGFIPQELFGAVAAILAELHKSGRRKFKI